MNPAAHVHVAQQSVLLLRRMTSNPSAYAAPTPTRPGWLGSMAPALATLDRVALAAGEFDFRTDLELVNVQRDRDNPHVDEWDAIDDVAHYEALDNYFTRFDHFIDIRKGPGLYDDFDGYSFGRGSGRLGGTAKVRDAAVSQFGRIGNVARLSSHGAEPLDTGLAWWFDDEYVHAPGQQWYRPGVCSTALEQYSRWNERGRFASNVAECLDRFPLAKPGGGYPQSVFMPVDNVGRYWFNTAVATTNADARAIALGGVLHAIQDATIPQHAAGTMGNWHSRYENDHQAHLVAWAADAAFNTDCAARFTSYNRDDASPPATLTRADAGRTPARNWPIDLLVTWLALQSFGVYEDRAIYNSFVSGYGTFNDAAGRRLNARAVAMGAIVLQRAAGPAAPAAPGAPAGGAARPSVARSFSTGFATGPRRNRRVLAGSR